MYAGDQAQDLIHARHASTTEPHPKLPVLFLLHFLMYVCLHEFVHILYSKVPLTARRGHLELLSLTVVSCHVGAGAKASPLRVQPVLLATGHSWGPCLLLEAGSPCGARQDLIL